MIEDNRRGFALVEMVSAAGLILVLTALQFPAIQRAREAARRAQCVNNLKQLSIAIHNYINALDSFPMSNVLGAGHGNGQGCFTLLLPWMEQAPLYNTYNFSLEAWHDANTTSVGVKVSSFLCPSNGLTGFTPAAEVRTQHDKRFPGKAKFAPGHYGANWGGVRPASGDEEAKAYAGSHLGLILTVVDPDAKEKTRTVALKDVTDGLSFTIALAEKKTSFGWAVGGWGGTEFDAYPTPTYEGDDSKLRRAFTGSYHEGGINVALGDGSVQFFKSGMAGKTWHALTTRAGGERVKLED